MSRWVHVTGCLYVETYKEESDIKKCVEEMLTDAPKITGSERDADIFINPLSGHNTWTNCDCEHCEYGKTVVHLEEGGFKCDAEDGYDCPDGEYQTCVAITIIGDLRDRFKDELMINVDVSLGTSPMCKTFTIDIRDLSPYAVSKVVVWNYMIG